MTKGAPLTDMFYDVENETLWMTTEDKQSLIKVNDKEKIGFDF